MIRMSDPEEKAVRLLKEAQERVKEARLMINYGTILMSPHTKTFLSIVRRELEQARDFSVVAALLEGTPPKDVAKLWSISRSRVSQIFNRWQKSQNDFKPYLSNYDRIEGEL